MISDLQKIADEVRERARNLSELAFDEEAFDWKNVADRIEAELAKAGKPFAYLCDGDVTAAEPFKEELRTIGYFGVPENVSIPLYLVPPDQTKRIEELERKLAEVKKDAERYRYLRRNWDRWSGTTWEINTEGMLDMNIDAALS